MTIDSSSIISNKANIHPDVIIGPFCIIGDDVEIDEVVTNKNIVDIQTPQVYKYKELFECYSFLSKNNVTGMVDTTESMFNYNKFETYVIRGEDSNLKITYKSDLETFEKVVI